MSIKVLQASSEKEFDEIVKRLLDGTWREEGGMSCVDCDDPTCENYCRNDNDDYYDPPQAVKSVKEPARKVIGSDIFEMAKMDGSEFYQVLFPVLKDFTQKGIWE